MEKKKPEVRTFRSNIKSLFKMSVIVFPRITVRIESAIKVEHGIEQLKQVLNNVSNFLP